MNSSILVRNNVMLMGQGSRPMLFAHGFGCDQNMWRFVAPSFAKDHRVVLFDYVGSGRSDLRAYNPERYSNLNGYAQDILDICAALDLKDVILVGHSVSAMIALLAAVKEPQRFHRLVLVCPSPRYVNDAPDYVGGFDRKDLEELLDTMDRNYIGWASFLAPLVMRNPDRPWLTSELNESFCSTDPIIARRFAEVTFFADNRRDLPKLTVPSLILQCSDDLLAPVSVGEYVHRHVPRSTLRIMRATGHCPHMSEPEETTGLIKEYLCSA
ncbi:alpha/beta fold hydrolase [Cystobacter ferrugineus]|uniref:Sigma factor SigB regulation protein RsbQ n=1 Tax=Cystobacter ferrugineus TaxID=83449 RepID=A0A1L9BKH3_9BACT|nr:alpha/beta hydrolase [Cystobacter ferrugineus]OJH42780.1 sigma factor SigB regulation protein RsbQ [Cystobacter ferrugineus]